MRPADRHKLAQEYVDIVEQVFIVKDRERLFNNVANPQHDVIKVRLFRNDDGAVVGFFKVTVDYGERNGRKYAAFNSHAGFLRAYRGSSSTLLLGLKVLLTQMLRHPSWERFYFGILIHPSSYSLFSRHALEYWPRWDRSTPPEQLRFLCEQADAYAPPASIYDPEHPLVRYYYLGTRTVEQEEEYWRRSERETVQYFLRVNPRYAQGAGIFTWIKLDGRLFRTAVLASLKSSLQRTASALRASLMQTALGQAMLPKPDIPSLLRTVPLFTALDARAIDTLARSSETVWLRGGTTIIEQGEAGDSMYVIAQGSAYVLLDGAGGEQVVDQLGKGDFFGEMSLLTGEPRIAAVRTATAMAAVKVDRATFMEFLRLNPAIEREMWRVFGQRRFDSYLLGQQRFRDLGRDQRKRWFTRGEQRDMNRADPITLQPTTIVFVVTGSVTVMDDTPLVVHAPALIERGEVFTILANKTARVCLLDRIDSAQH